MSERNIGRDAPDVRPLARAAAVLFGLTDVLVVLLIGSAFVLPPLLRYPETSATAAFGGFLALFGLVLGQVILLPIIHALIEFE